MLNIVNFLKKYNHQLLIILSLLLSLTIFIFRNRALLHIPNFYAEDATVIFSNVYNSNPAHALLASFNGYLIVGLYVLAYIARIVNYAIGNNIENLPLITFFVSCAFLALCSSMPVILYRKNLGATLSVICVVLLSFVPMYSYDYAIIGTFGNLKFAFLFLAFMLSLFLIVNPKLSGKKRISVHLLLLLCVLSDVTVAFVVPFLLLPAFLKYIKTRNLNIIKTQKLEIFSLLFSLIYVSGALIRGIPKLPGYLDTPFKFHSLFPIIERSTTYSFLYAINPLMNNPFVIILLIFSAFTVFLYVKRKPSEVLPVLLALWSIFLGTFLFVVNRPGISEYYMSYGHKGGPDQFFYAQNMIFIFIFIWIIKDFFNRYTSFKKLSFLMIGVLYLMISIPYATSNFNNYDMYKNIGSFKDNLHKSCIVYKDQKNVIVQIDVSPYWQWSLSREKYCKY